MQNWRCLRKYQDYFLSGGLVALALAIWWFGFPGGLYAKTFGIGSAVCHQLPSHSYFFGKHQFPLCARCTGQYLGFWVTTSFLWWKRRLWTARWPRGHLLLAVGLLFLLWAIDGVNSYVSTFFGYMLLYAPHNLLRLLTGTGEGIALTLLVWPFFNMLVWRRPPDVPVLVGWREFLLLLAGGLVLDAAVYFGTYAVRLVLAYTALAGVPFFLTLIWTMIVLVVAGKENGAEHWGDFRHDVALALLLAVSMIWVMARLHGLLLPVGR